MLDNFIVRYKFFVGPSWISKVGYMASDGGSISKVGGPKPKIRFLSFAIRAGSGVVRNFIKGGGRHNFHIFFKRIFSAELI